MPDPSRYPGYDVLRKRHTPSWNDKTRQVIDARLAVPREPRFFDTHELATVTAIADPLVPQPRNRPPIPVAALIDDKLHKGQEDGFRHEGMPREREAWRRGRGARAWASTARWSTGSRTWWARASGRASARR